MPRFPLYVLACTTSLHVQVTPDQSSQMCVADVAGRRKVCSAGLFAPHHLNSLPEHCSVHCHVFGCTAGDAKATTDKLKSSLAEALHL